MASLTTHQRQTLGAVLDALIPPRESLGGAGALGLGDAVAREVDKMSGALDALGTDLAALDAAGGSRGAAAFAALEEPERSEALAAHAETDPGFLPGLVFHAYIAYYQDPRVVAALGLEPRPPHPEGYAMEPTDLESLTANIRTRAAFFRKP